LEALRDNLLVTTFNRLCGVLCLFLATILFSGSAECGQADSTFDHQHLEWKAIVDKFVTSDGALCFVAYPKLIEQKQSLLDYVAKLVAVTPKQYESFTKDQKLVFLVNAYNAFTMQQIVERYPIGSITEIQYGELNAWQEKRYTLISKKLSLDELENKWIRPKFKEPLAHFALVCASMGCPGLRWYSASEFKAQATESAKAFLGDPRRNSFDPASLTLKLSEIFDWYKEDFIRAKGSVAAYVSQFVSADPKVQASIVDASKKRKLKTEFLPYDWSLNEKK
jgi:hypothetical protein